MAKLSKMEISAIAAQIYENICSSAEEYNKKLKDSAFEVWKGAYSTTEDYKILLKFKKLTSDLSRITTKLPYKSKFDNYNVDSIIKEIFNNETTLIFKNTYKVSLQNIERDIIIAQAKNEDLDALIASLTEKYSK